MAVIANLVAKFSADTKGFTKGTSAMSRGITGLKVGILGLIGTAGFGAMIKGAIESADEIGHLANRLGSTTEALSEMRFVADQAGVSFKTLTVGMQRMTRRLAEVAEFGKGAAKDALETLNLSAEKLIELRPEEQYEKIADALSKVENQSLKVALAMKIFDTEGVALLQTMDDGAAGIRRYREEAKRLGKSLSQEQVDAAQRAANAFGKLKFALTGVTDQFALSLAGPIADFITVFTDILPRAMANVAGGMRVIGQVLAGMVRLTVQLASSDILGAFGTLRDLRSDIALSFAGTSGEREASNKQDKVIELLEENNRLNGEMSGTIRLMVPFLGIYDRRLTGSEF